ncbi:MAG: 3-dehydroquinate synthase [Nitrososphaerota archaeon]|nr:3-dehydroquinate synthase [Nitrososphaerota archaeon]
MATLSIGFENRSRCEIFINSGILSRIPLRFFSNASSIFVITDDVVSRLYSSKILAQLLASAASHVIEIPHGEKSKSLETASSVASKLSRLGADRKSVVVALGGGVVGDLAGFVASLFKRGVKFIQMPTTLLAQVDSSIGGKTGVDTFWGKNQLGTFYQPSAVITDPSTLDTLPKKELINGLAEIVKSAIIADKEMFSELEKTDLSSIKNVKKFIANTARIKAQVAEEDEKENNIRSTLNYGHTIGHAIEASSNFKMSHGGAVILGMSAEGWISKELGMFKDYDMQETLLQRIRPSSRVKLDKKKILAFAKLDKKNVKGTIRMSLPKRIGNMAKSEDGAYAIPVEKNLILSALEHLEFAA